MMEDNFDDEEEGILVMAEQEAEDCPDSSDDVGALSPKTELVIEMDATNEEMDVVIDDDEDADDDDDDDDDEKHCGEGPSEESGMKRDVFLDKLPRPVRELNCRMARSYLVKLLRVANGGQNPQYGRADTCPPFWPNYYWPWTRLTDVHTKPIGMNEPLQYSEMMKLAIAKGYQYFGYDPDVYVDNSKTDDGSECNSNVLRWQLDVTGGSPPKLPRPLSKLNCVQARTSLSKLLRFQQGGSNPMYGSPETRPPWWPDELIRWIDMVDLRGKPPYLPDQRTYTDVLRAAIERALRYYRLNPETYVDYGVGSYDPVPSPSSSFALPALKTLPTSTPSLRPILPKLTPLISKNAISSNASSPITLTTKETKTTSLPPSSHSSSQSSSSISLSSSHARSSSSSEPPRLPRPIKKLNCGGVRVALSKLLWFYNNNQPPNYGNPDSMPSWWPDHLMEWRLVKNLRHRYDGQLRNSYTNCLRIALIRGYAHYGLDPNEYHNESDSNRENYAGNDMRGHDRSILNGRERKMPPLKALDLGSLRPMPALKPLLDTGLKHNDTTNVTLKSVSSPFLNLVSDDVSRELYVDLKLVAKDGQTVHVHRAFLAASSASRSWSIMQQLMLDTSDMACIVLPDISFTCLQHLASIMYSGTVNVDDMTQLEELQLALKMIQRLGLMTKVRLNEHLNEDKKREAMDTELEDLFKTFEDYYDEDYEGDDVNDGEENDSNPPHGPKRHLCKTKNTSVKVKLFHEVDECIMHDTPSLQQRERDDEQKEDEGELEQEPGDHCSENEGGRMNVEQESDADGSRVDMAQGSKSSEDIDMTIDIDNIKVELDPEPFVVSVAKGSISESSEASVSSKEPSSVNQTENVMPTRRPVRKRKAPAAFAEFVSDLSFNFEENGNKTARSKSSRTD